MSTFTTREKVLAIVAALCALAAIGMTVFHFATAVPSTAAAKVNNTYISESDIAADINQYRSMYSLTDDTDFATAVVSAGESIASFRQDMIDTRITKYLVDERAKELGVVPTDDEIQEQYDAAVNSYGFGDADTWKSTLESYGMTEDSYKDQIKYNIEQAAILEKDVAREDATDDDALSYAEGNLVGVSQKHYYRIMLTGDDLTTKEAEVIEKLKELKDAGALNTDTFSELARTYSDEANVESTGGSFAWDVEIIDDNDLGPIIDDLSVGEYSESNSVASDDNAHEILYCDTEYSFPTTDDDMANLQASDVPESLWSVVKEKASDALWETNCDVYLDNMLSQAKVTYYPIPDNASYNIKVNTTSATE